MLKIAITTGCLPKTLEVDEQYRMYAEAGFDGVDASINRLFPFASVRDLLPPEAFSDEKTLIEGLTPYKKAAEKYGLSNFMAHAPFPVWTSDEAYDEKLWEILSWYVHGCDAIGCRTLVVHPVTTRLVCPLTREEEIEKSLQLYRKLAPAAKQYGVTVCTENMFRNVKSVKHTKVYESMCADIPEACAMLDRLNGEAGEERFGFCLDTGHLLLLGKDVARAISQLGSRLKALHIHDNDGNTDQHLLPYMGIQNWEHFLDGVAASDYQGVLNFETDGLDAHVDPALYPATLRYLAEIGRVFASRIEEKRAAR